LEGKKRQKWTESCRKHWAEEAEKERIALEQKKIQEEERQKFKDLLESAKKHREAVMLREYI
jgi:hypothetical protein